MVLSPQRLTAVSICDECLLTCNRILAENAKDAVEPPKGDYRIKAQPELNRLRCSFCGISQEKACWLISAPKDKPRTYICDKCVALGDEALNSVPTKRTFYRGWFARKICKFRTTVHRIG